MDVKLAEVKRLVNQQSGCASSSVRCMLLSETGHVIYHPDFAASAEETSEEVFLSKKHREVTAVLVQGLGRDTRLRGAHGRVCTRC